jgi:hypothetical protein
VQFQRSFETATAILVKLLIFGKFDTPKALLEEEYCKRNKTTMSSLICVICCKDRNNNWINDFVRYRLTQIPQAKIQIRFSKCNSFLCAWIENV